MNKIAAVAIGVRNVNTKSGLGKIILEQIKYFKGVGIEVDIYAHKVDKNIQNIGANIIKINKIPFFNEYYQRLFFAKIAQGKIKKKNYDLIIGHGDLIDQDILFLHNLVEKTYFLTYQKKMQPLNHLARFRRLILTQQHYKVLIANSMLMKNALIKEFHINSEKIEVLYPAYNAQQFNVDNIESKRHIARNKLNITNEEMVIGFITSGDFTKRALPLFIEALHHLPKNLNYRVLLVGKDKKGMQYLEKAREYGIYENFIICEPKDSVEEYFYAVDFDVHSAYFEEFGMVVEEAMACGVPVITSHMVGASEIMLDKSTLMQKPNVEDLTQLIEKLMTDSTYRQQLSIKAIESVKGRTWNDYINKFIAITKKI